MGAALRSETICRRSSCGRWRPFDKLRSERDGRAAARMCAIAHALEGISRAEAARLAGMDRQALRDAVVRYNAEGLAGLHERRGGRRAG
jgi:transposase